MKGFHKCEHCGSEFQWVAYPRTDKNNPFIMYDDGAVQNISSVDIRDGKNYCFVKCPRCLKTKEIEIGGNTK